MAVGLGMLGMLSLPVRAQAQVGVPCSVRIRSLASADYDAATEVLLHGLVVGWEQGLLLLRIPAGTVRVEVGPWAEAIIEKGLTEVQLLAAKRQDEGGQRLVARELRYGGGLVAIRDANGVPLKAERQL